MLTLITKLWFHWSENVLSSADPNPPSCPISSHPFKRLQFFLIYCLSVWNRKHFYKCCHQRLRFGNPSWCSHLAFFARLCCKHSENLPQDLEANMNAAMSSSLVCCESWRSGSFVSLPQFRASAAISFGNCFHGREHIIPKHGSDAWQAYLYLLYPA